MHNASINKFSVSEEAITTSGHSPVIRSYIVDNGNGNLNAGLAVSLDGAGEIVPYDETNEPNLKGLVAEYCDIERHDAAMVIVHGTVRKDKILEGGAAPSDALLNKLEDIGIWPV